MEDKGRYRLKMKEQVVKLKRSIQNGERYFPYKEKKNKGELWDTGDDV